MKRLLKRLLLACIAVVAPLCTPVAPAQTSVTTSHIIEEADTSPSGRLMRLKVSNGTLTSNGGGSFSLNTKGQPGGINGSIQYNNSGVLSGNSTFVFVDGNVGIGTTRPLALLHVNGIVNASRYYVGSVVGWNLSASPTTHNLTFEDNGQWMSWNQSLGYVTHTYSTNPAYMRYLNATLEVFRNSIADTPTDGLKMYNNKLSTVGIPVQYAPSLYMYGGAWDINDAEDVIYEWRIANIPATANTTYSNLVFSAADSLGPFYDSFTVRDSGEMGLGYNPTENDQNRNHLLFLVSLGADFLNHTVRDGITLYRRSLFYGGDNMGIRIATKIMSTEGNIINATAIESVLLESDAAAVRAAMHFRTVPTGTTAPPTIRLAVSSPNSYFIDTNVGIGTTAPTDTLVAGNIAIPSVYTNTREPTGFYNRTATLSWTHPTYTLTITGDHTIYQDGVKTAKTTDSKQIANTTGTHYIYYNTTGVLTEGTAHPGFYLPLMATVYWNNVTNKGLAGEERHGITMDGATHEFIHDTIGTRYESGLDGTFADTTFTIAEGAIHDEDIGIDITPQTTCDVLYKDGTTDYKWLAAQTKYYYEDGGSDINYNNGNTLTAVPANQYVAYWIFASNAITNPILSLMGQRVDVTLADARANNKYESLTLGTLPFAEMKLLYRVILRNDATPYEEVQDLRSVSNVPGGSYIATTHGALSGLNWASAGHTFDTALNTGTQAIVTLGNLGVGTTAPRNTVEVKGKIRIVDDSGISTDWLTMNYSQAYYGRLLYSIEPNNTRSEVKFASTGASATGQTYFVIAESDGSVNLGQNLLMGVSTDRAFVTNAFDYANAGTLHLGGNSWSTTGVIEVGGNPAGSNSTVFINGTLRVGTLPFSGLVVLRDGNVGIGTTNPTTKMVIFGSGSTPAQSLMLRAGVGSTAGGSRILVVKPGGACSSCGADDADAWNCIPITCP